MDQNRTTEYAHVLAIAFDHPQKLVHVDELSFEIDSVYNSPMGMNLAAFIDAKNGKGKALMNWNSVQKKIASSSFQQVVP